MHCVTCYESPPICRGGTAGVACSTYPCGFPNAYRGPSGHYGEVLRRSLPEELSGVDDVHLDVLTGHQETAAAVVVWSAADAALDGGRGRGVVGS